MTAAYANIELAATLAPHARRTPGWCAFVAVQVSEAFLALSGIAVRIASPSQFVTRSIV